MKRTESKTVKATESAPRKRAAATATQPKRGRPPIGADVRKLVGFRLGPAEHALLAEAAALEGLGVSTWIRKTAMVAARKALRDDAPRKR